MKFYRRPDLDEKTRLWLALAMRYRGFRDWGRVVELARRFDVSRQFLYKNERILARAFAPDTPAPDLTDERLHQLILCLRLYGHSSLESISQTLAEMGWGPCSTGHISEFLRATSAACSIELACRGRPRTLLLDEIFDNGGDPILIVMDALTHYILAIVKAPDRKAETWIDALRQLQAQDVNIERLVKDLGNSMQSAAQTLGIPERADLFHLLQPFDPFLAGMQRRAYGALQDEYDRARVFENSRREPTLEKRLAQYETAVTNTAKALRASDAYDYLHLCLHEAFDSFTPDGQARTRAMAQADIHAVLDLLAEEFPHQGGLQDAVKSLRKHLADYQSYFEQLEEIVLRHKTGLPETVLHAACLAWQLNKKSVAVKSYAWKKELLRQSDEWLQFAGADDDDQLRSNAIRALFADLEANIRSSSPLEAINSIVRDFLNTCRGQTTQESLTLLACFLNHRCATRGKYAGTSPHQRLTGTPEKGSPIKQLLHMAPRSVQWASLSPTRAPTQWPLRNVA